MPDRFLFRTLLLSLLCWLGCQPLLAQRSEIWRQKPGTWVLNTGLGLTRYMGDLSAGGDRVPLRLGAALNVATAYRLSRQLSLRSELQLYYVHGSQQRTYLAYNNLSFHSLNPDAWVGVQWDFWKAENPNHVFIPYALAGIGLTYMTPRATYKGKRYSLAPLQTEGVRYNRLPLIIRYGLGAPLLATERFEVHLEGTYTHVRSDYLDDVSTVYPTSQGRDALTIALTDRRYELGTTPNEPGDQRGNSTRRDGYFVLAGRLVFIISTPAQRNYTRMFSR